MNTNKPLIAAVLAGAVGAPIADRQFEIEFFGPGVETFSLTFG
jgi:hypothetical protein